MRTLRKYRNAIILLVVGIILVPIIKRLRRKNKAEDIIDHGGESYVKEVRDSINGATISTSEALRIANELYHSMNHFFGTDEKRIFSSLENTTKEDRKLIYAEFGLREYSVIYGGEPDAFSRLVLNDTENVDLITWFNHELSGSDLEDIKELFDF